MRLSFTKQAGKHDSLLIEREGGPPLRLTAPKQGIIPHEMVHYAVESVLVGRGFLNIIADGAEPTFATGGGAAEEAAERLVEVFQAELWGGAVPVEELLATYHHACAARGHAAVPVSADDIAAIRARLAELGTAWAATAVGETLTLTL